ncbi:MAG: protein translocase subunit SecF [Alphaproteobacteria bacterium]|nr:protein translocase subunit SecF [Alphaproteobacteria bacterium]
MTKEKETKKGINFIGARFFAFLLSSLLIIGSIYITSSKGLNFGTDFTGGILMEVKTPEPANLSNLRETLKGLDIGEVQLQTFGSNDTVLINIAQPKDGDAPATITKVKDSLGQNLDYRRTEFVGPKVGKELVKAGILAVVLSVGAMLIYIWFRFEWQFAVSAILALSHDVIATIGLFAIFQMEFNLSTVAAILTIAGYSINDTVVVFDRVRENLRKYKSKALTTLLNDSINEMLTRTLLTSITTLIALISLWVFGGEVIRGFVVALIWGVAIGTYSSIFVASSCLIYLRVKR